MWVGGITADIADNRELAVRGSERLLVDEGRNRLRKVDAVDEDVG